MTTKSTVRIEYHSVSDNKDRCSFSLYWLSNYHPGHPDGEHVLRERGQCYFADPREYGYSRPEDLSPTELKKLWSS